jgi:hypothetical protein
MKVKELIKDLTVDCQDDTSIDPESEIEITLGMEEGHSTFLVKVNILSIYKSGDKLYIDLGEDEE